MQYTVMIYETEADFAARTDPEKCDAYWANWPPYRQALVDAGVFVGGAGLQNPDTTTSIRLRDGRPLVQDGPFADTKEQLGGFFIIETEDLDSALRWAAKCPISEGGGVEVRPNLKACSLPSR